MLHTSQGRGVSERILMQASGAVRPLRFAAGPRIATGDSPGWSGVPVEVLPLRDWEGDSEVGPLQGALGILVFLHGQVEFVARGRGQDRAWIARQGDATLVSGECPARMLRCRGQAEVAAVDLSAGWLRAVLGSYRPPARATLSAELQRTLACNVRRLMQHWQQPEPPDRLAVEAISFELVSDLLDALPGGSDPEATAGLDALACRRLKDYVRAHVGQPVTHGELAAQVGLSPRRFSSAFKQAFGTTPYQYVLSTRLGEAARLLRTSERDLAEIAYDLGFSSQSHFSTAFRRAFQLRPRDYASGIRSSLLQRGAHPPRRPLQD